MSFDCTLGMDYIRKQPGQAERQYTSLRSRMKFPANIRFTRSGSPIDSKRNSTSNPACRNSLSQSGLSIGSSTKAAGRGSQGNATLSGAHRETKACVYTTTQERSNKVLVTETPISMRIVNEKLQELNQMRSFL